MNAPSAQKKIKVGLVEINNTFSGQHYLPYSTGTLVAYAQKFCKNIDQFEFMRPIYYRVPVDTAVEQLMEADLACFSAYVWNIRISLEIAKRLKARKPEILIVFGGPHVPNHAEAFLRQNREIDVACHNEGERIFTALLENYATRDWAKVPGVSYLDKDGGFVTNPWPARIENMSDFPSPYLTGFFTDLMAANPNEKWMCVWETNRGCPFSCAFCDWGSATQSRVYKFDMERINSEIDWFSKHKLDFVFCADANFGILPRDIDIVKSFADYKVRTGYPKALQVLTAKNANERVYQVHKVLLDAGLNKGVTISFQSMNQTTLQAIKRGNISTQKFSQLQQQFTKENIGTYTDIILGLPDETYDTFKQGVSFLIDNGQHSRIQFNNLSILPNAEMGDPEYQKKHGMVLVETPIVSMHGSFEELDKDVKETQILVVGTASAPPEEWVKIRVFAWLVSLLHYDKLLQLPIVLMHALGGVAYDQLFELFLGDLGKEYPVLQEIKDFFIFKAQDMQKGGSENCLSREWLNIYWPEDEYMIIKMCREGKLDAFYAECENLLQKYLNTRGLSLPTGVLHEAIIFNRKLVKQPFQLNDITMESSFNLWEFYRSYIEGHPIALEQRSTHYVIARSKIYWTTWDDWCREVIWYGNKKGAYLYGSTEIESQRAEPQPAGHY